MKKYPADYSEEILKVIRAMSFTNGRGVKLVGSFTLRNQVYAGDVDALEFVKVKSAKDCAKRFQEVVKKVSGLPYTYISDIKCGTVDEWRVIPDSATIEEGKVVGYDRDAILKNVERLHSINIIDASEYRLARYLLKPTVNAVEFLALQKELRFNILRWNLDEIKKGYKILRDGRKYTLEAGVQSPTITKLDVISWIQGMRFSDFEMIYEFSSKGKILNKGLRDLDIAIKESILLMRREGNYFKMAKRMYALARYHKYKHDLQPLNDLFNGDLGRLYGIYGDANSLKYLIENAEHLPKDKIATEIDTFITRLSNVVIPTFLIREHAIMRIIKRLSDPSIYTSGNEKMIKLLDGLRHYIFVILSNASLKYLKEARLFPLASKYLP